jgi:hypothetical protein
LQDAADWQARVVSNGGTVSTATMNAVKAFCQTIVQQGLRDRFYRLNLFAGDDLSAAMVPVFVSPSRTGTQFGNATDTNNNFVSADYGLATGLQGNKASKSLDTGFMANTLPANNSHLSAGILASDSSTSGDDRTIIGAWDGAASVLEMRAVDFGGAVPLVSAFTRYGTESDRFGDSVASVSLAAGNVLCAWPSMYRNGVTSGATATTSFDFPDAIGIYVFSLNATAAGFGSLNITDARLGYYSIGATMSGPQATAFSNAIDAFYSAIGRA